MPLIIYLISLFACLLSMFGVWLIQRRLQNGGIVDVCWGLHFVGVAILYFVLLSTHSLRDLIFLSMIALWGFRLSWHIFLRFRREKHEDSRYLKMRQDWKQNADRNMLFFFWIQGFTVWMLSGLFLVIFADQSHQDLSVVEICAAATWLIALVGESVADSQLRIFKNNEANRGKVCQSGLWNYSRHPNYFFECMIWVSFYVFALGSKNGVWMFYSPALMIYFIVMVSGVPPAEASSLKSRGDLYREYQKSTSVLIPWFKRK